MVTNSTEEVQSLKLLWLFCSFPLFLLMRQTPRPGSGCGQIVYVPNLTLLSLKTTVKDSGSNLGILGSCHSLHRTLCAIHELNGPLQGFFLATWSYAWWG